MKNSLFKGLLSILALTIITVAANAARCPTKIPASADEERKLAEAGLGASCLDCHINGHTNAAFHLDPDTRPRQNRFRIDTDSLHGMFSQQVHGSTRSLRSVEDFTKFEQRAASFDGDETGPGEGRRKGIARREGLFRQGSLRGLRLASFRARS